MKESLSRSEFFQLMLAILGTYPRTIGSLPPGEEIYRTALAFEVEMISEARASLDDRFMKN